MLSMTAEENFRIYGTISPDQIVELLDQAAEFEKMEDAVAHVEEAKGCFPREDFLHGEIAELYEWTKGMRGERKQDFTSLIERIIQARDDVNQSSEYGADELKKALEMLS